MRKALFSTLAAPLLLIGGCTMIPTLPNITSSAPDAYPQGSAYDPLLANTTAEQSLQDMTWQRFFRDARLKSLIAIGLRNNRDLKQAAYDIAEARALYGIERSALIPDVTASGSYTRQKIPEDAGSSAGSARIAGASGAIIDTYTAQLGIAAYELDVFGRLRSLSRAALNEYFATQAAQDSVRISLVASIATTYTNLVASKAQLRLAQSTQQAQQDAFDLISLRAQEGVASDLERRQAEILLHQARADTFRFLYAVSQNQNALRLLLGTPRDMTVITDAVPETVSAELLGGLVSDMPVGLPSALLTSRPDITEAEYRLKAANANIGAARAAFFPSISLTGAGGYQSDDLSGLFSSGTRFWQFAPQITLPLFTGGRLRNTLDVAKVRTNAAVNAYEQTIETAFREVADALAAVSTYDDRMAAQQDLITATEEAASLSNLRFDAGIENYLSVLDAQRELYAARQTFLQQLAEQVNAKIGLYRAVGGGR